MKITACVLALASVVAQVAAHGYVPIIRVNGVEYPGWDISKDPYTTPAVRFIATFNLLRSSSPLRRSVQSVPLRTIRDSLPTLR